MPNSKNKPAHTVPGDIPIKIEDIATPPTVEVTAESSVPNPIAGVGVRPEPLHEGFTGEEFSRLTENENWRYESNSKHIGHVVLSRDSEGKKLASQYQLPKGSSDKIPEVCSLSNIEEITRYGMIRHQATGPNGKKFYARRYDHARVKMNEDDDVASVDFAYFSEEEKAGKEPFWGSKNELPRFRKNLSKKAQAELNAELAEIAAVTKGGPEMAVDAESVRFRDENRTRKPDQNTLMGESARDTYEHFYSAMSDALTPELCEILKRAFNADLRKAPENQFRPEWLHAYGFSLVPTSQNPQRKDNLGAAGKWVNTEMMVLERVAKWFSLARNASSRITIKTLFDMLIDSELINKIHFEVNIELKNRFVRFIQDLDAFKKSPVFRKATDLAQATGIAYAILHDEKPTKIEPVKGAPIRPQLIKKDDKKIDSRNTATPMPADIAHSSAPIDVVKKPDPVVNSNAQNKKSLVITPGEKIMPKSKSKSKSNFPTQLKHENSIVQVISTSHEPDYEEPWSGTHIQSSSGTGSVIEHKGEKFILTNAHCVENYIRTQIRFANDHQEKFDAEPICVSYQCDLALLRINDPKFQELAQPVVLGEMVRLHDKIVVNGFPIGGNEISVTKGIVSRIEVQDYSMSDLDMLQVQVDAAINSGNSGGAAFSNGKMVGVPFQGCSAGESLGYIIPIPIVKHFLQEAFGPAPYRGFPILPISIQHLDNKWQRRFYGMSREQSGVLVTKTNILCDAHQKLKSGDILLEIDGFKISNEGKVDLPDVGKCIDLVHITHMKYIGDSVHLKVLRKKDASNETELLDIDVILDHVPRETEVVPQTEHDKLPTYYINSGFVFVPVTRNYLDGPGSDLADLTILDPEYGAMKISDAPKKTPDQQYIAINSVLNCESTEGYDDFTHHLIYKVNGQLINNFKELITTMDSYEGEIHLIETRDAKKIALKKLSPAELKKLMDSHKISFDRSEELRAQATVSVISVDDTALSESISDSSYNSHSDADADSEASDDTVESTSDTETQESSVGTPVVAKAKLKMSRKSNALVCADGRTPGEHFYGRCIAAMEQRYKNAPENGEEFDFDAVTENESSSSDDTADEVKSTSRALPSRKRGRTEVEDVQEQPALKHVKQHPVGRSNVTLFAAEPLKNERSDGTVDEVKSTSRALFSRKRRRMELDEDVQEQPALKHVKQHPVGRSNVTLFAPEPLKREGAFILETLKQSTMK